MYNRVPKVHYYICWLSRFIHDTITQTWQKGLCKYVYIFEGKRGQRSMHRIDTIELEAVSLKNIHQPCKRFL